MTLNVGSACFVSAGWAYRHDVPLCLVQAQLFNPSSHLEVQVVNETGKWARKYFLGQKQGQMAK